MPSLPDCNHVDVIVTASLLVISHCHCHPLNTFHPSVCTGLLTNLEVAGTEARLQKLSGLLTRTQQLMSQTSDKQRHQRLQTECEQLDWQLKEEQNQYKEWKYAVTLHTDALTEERAEEIRREEAIKKAHLEAVERSKAEKQAQHVQLLEQQHREREEMELKASYIEAERAAAESDMVVQQLMSQVAMANAAATAAKATELEAWSASNRQEEHCQQVTAGQPDHPSYYSAVSPWLRVTVLQVLRVAFSQV